MNVAYIFPPPWDPACPPYVMALFEASTKLHGHAFFGFDLNVDLFNAVSEEDKDLWKGQYAIRWEGESNRIIEQYSGVLNALLARLLTLNIRLYAIYTSVYSKQIALFIARKIKQHDAASSVILGGAQCFPSYDGLRILENEFVDAICTGEGDSVWPAVLECVSKHGNLHCDVPGIAYRGTDGTIVDGGVPELITDLNSIPCADYSSVDFAKYAKGFYLSTMTSRGCINTCAFCSERPNFYQYRHRSAENILAEIVRHLEVLQSQAEHAPVRQAARRSFSQRVFSRGKEICSLFRLRRETGVWEFLRQLHDWISGLNVGVRVGWRLGSIPYIGFNDSLLNGSIGELEKFCDMVIERGIKFKWGGMALLRQEMTRQLLAKMKKAGCHSLMWGLESGSQGVLTLMRKRFFTMDLAKRIIKDTSRVGIKQSISLIVGFPGETEEMFQETLQFVRAYKKYFYRVGAQPMMILRNSRVYDKHGDFGLDYENAQQFLEWRTMDGTNDYNTRLKRLEVLTSILKDQILRIDK